MPEQAQAQTEPVWSTTMTVGEATVAGGFGYSIDGEEGVAGSVGTNTFSYGDPPETRWVQFLLVSEELLTFQSGVGDISIALPSDWVLVVAGESLPLSPAAIVSGVTNVPTIIRIKSIA